jgi:outer membrane protein
MKTFRVLIALFFVTVIYQGDAFAQVTATTEKETLKFSLAEAQEYAVKNFKDAKNAELDKRITKNQTIEIITEGLPQISGAFNYQNNFKLQTNIIPAGVFGPNEVRLQFGTPYVANTYLNIDQLIVDGRYFLGLKANKAFIELADKQAELTSVDIITNVSKAYYGCLLNVQVEKLLQSNLEIANTLMKETEAYYNAGLREELDVDKLKLNVSQIKSQIEIAKYRTASSVNTLKYLMGLTLTTQVELTDKLEALMTTEEMMLDEKNFNPKSRLEYKLLQTQHEIRGYDKKRFALGYMPALYGNFNYGINTFSQDANVFKREWFPYGNWGLSLQVPIFDSYKKGALFQQKKLDQQKIMNNIEAFESSAKLDVENKMQAYTTAIENHKNQKLNYALAEKIYKTARTKYNNGVGNSVELAQTESSFTEAQRNYLQSIFDVLASKLDLDKALGKIK